MLKHLHKLPRRLLKSHGYGVHSPFAYHFITKVLREKEAVYYAYPEIASFCPRTRKTGFNEIFAGRDMSVPEAWLLFRVLCHINPVHIVEMGNGHEVTTVIFNRAVPRATVHTWHNGRHPDRQLLGQVEPFVLVNQFNDNEAEMVNEYLHEVITSGDSVIYLRNLKSMPAMKRIWEKLCGITDFGMGFTDGYTGIFVGRRKLPHQIYDIFI